MKKFFSICSEQSTVSNSIFFVKTVFPLVYYTDFLLQGDFIRLMLLVEGSYDCCYIQIQAYILTTCEPVACKRGIIYRGSCRRSKNNRKACSSDSSGVKTKSLTALGGGEGGCGVHGGRRGVTLFREKANATCGSVLHINKEKLLVHFDNPNTPCKKIFTS
jgi:hypothetical protein